jgi:hypothetical protein
VLGTRDVSARSLPVTQPATIDSGELRVSSCSNVAIATILEESEASDPLHQQLLASIAMTGIDLRKWRLVFHLVGIPVEASKGEFAQAKDAVRLYVHVHSDLQERSIRPEVVLAALRAGKTTVDLAACGNADQRAHDGMYRDGLVYILYSSSTQSRLNHYPFSTHPPFCPEHLPSSATFSNLLSSYPFSTRHIIITLLIIIITLRNRHHDCFTHLCTPPLHS